MNKNYTPSAIALTNGHFLWGPDFNTRQRTCIGEVSLFLFPCVCQSFREGGRDSERRFELQRALNSSVNKNLCPLLHLEIAVHGRLL